MMTLIKGYDNTIEVDSLTLEDIASWKLVGESTTYTLSGCTLSGNTLSIPAADIATVPVADYFIYGITSSSNLLKVAEVYVNNLVYEKSHYRKTLEALQATLEGRATKEQMEVQVAGRMVRYLTLTELIQAINQYKQLAEQEERRNSITSNSFSGILRTRWGH